MDNAEYEKIIKACRFCLMCRHLCTTGNITYAEANTPRGHALMLDCMGSDALEDTPDNRKRAAEVLYECCYCGQCQNNCVSSYKHPDMIMKARASVPEEDLPENVKKIREIINSSGGIYEKGSQYAGKTDIIGADVLLYAGSFIRNQDPKIEEAAISVLEKAGVNYTFLSNEGGSGMDAYLLGMAALSQNMLSNEINRINALKPATVVTLSPDDQRILSGDIPGLDAHELDVPVIGFSSYAGELIKDGKLDLIADGKNVIAYHDSDQGGRFSGDYEAPRDILKAIPGISYKELFWNKGEAASAGESGAIRALDKGLADKIARKRMDQIDGNDIDILITDSPEAKAQLADTGSEKIKIEHIAEFLYKYV